ncbi:MULTISPECIES: hypothetical protein [Halomonadaceae]|uniref:hypothetical protein n=1 Tax=Halomonadaceae TaxID=28256 RepID=UPI001582011C|nr:MULTISPECIES: hypothetical protein [Halomonas]MDI4636715.1 hypothetical protein [Halomonas sp. BMC7]NUJ61080.1 hypothetical protein [Halomonas taeanensis]
MPGQPTDNVKLAQSLNYHDLDTPLLILFSKDENNIYSIKFKLISTSTEEAYNSLNERLKFGTSVVAGLKKENYKNADGVKNALYLRYGDWATFEILKTGTKILPFISRIFGVTK